MAASLMRAARFRKDTRTLTIEEVPTPDPPRGFVRIRVDACGICGSDVSLLAGTIQPAPDVITPGHEAAGTIDAFGEDVPSIWSQGQRVVIAPGRACRVCEGCANSGSSACMNLKVMGFDFDGALAEYVIAPHQALVAVPDDRPMAEWAVLSDAVATPFAALTDTGQLHVAEAVAIWGVGGIGLPAVQIARALGAAPIIAVDPRSSSRERALAIGADLALDPDADDVRERILAATRGRGLDLVLDNVGTSATIRAAMSHLAADGRVVVAGISGGALDLGSAMKFVVRGRHLRGHFGYDRAHLQQLVTLVAHGRLNFASSVSDLLPLSATADGLARLAARSEDVVRLFVQPWR